MEKHDAMIEVKTQLVNHSTTDYRNECVSKKGRVGTEQYFKWIEGFTVNERQNACKFFKNFLLS
jgi:hypothetical protein